MMTSDLVLNQNSDRRLVDSHEMHAPAMLSTLAGLVVNGTPGQAWHTSAAGPRLP